MNRGLARLSDLLPAGLLADLHDQKHKPTKPDVDDRPPIHKPPKVIGDPTREPVNRQAALLTMKAGWLYQPLPPEAPPKDSIEKLREENAKLTAQNARLTAHVATLQRQVDRLRTTKQCPVRPPAPPPTPEPTPELIEKQKLLEKLTHGT